MRPRDADAHLTAMLERAGLDVGHLDLWESWKVFKAFAKTPVEADGEGIGVYLGQDEAWDGDRFRIDLLRQFTAFEGEESVPVWGTWFDFIIDSDPAEMDREVEIWSYDFPTFADFAAEVERHPAFQRATALRVRDSAVRGGQL